MNKLVDMFSDQSKLNYLTVNIYFEKSQKKTFNLKKRKSEA